jgi:GT2 family glycosyltransferase/glycosyltransferase involved in cell wall biosynthesis
VSRPAVSVVVPTLGGDRLERLLDSLARQTAEHETLVVDNGSPGRAVRDLCARFGAQALRLEENAGYSRACNLGAERASGHALVLLNDDSVCDPDFLDRIVAPLDPAAGVVMAAGVMRDWGDPQRIDSAGMELDHTLLVFDYLNGEPLTRLDEGVDDPIGPSGAAAAFDLATYRTVQGFDERLFAYWEDVDLVLRLRRLGFRCALAPDARGVHEHSASLGSGSRRKNYLMGFGRGYVLRKWGVVTPRRAGAVLGRELALCVGQALVDRNLAGVRGRLQGYRAATDREHYPDQLRAAGAPGPVADLRRRAARRARLRSRGDGTAAGPAGARALRTLAIFHVAEAGGPLRSLEAELEWLGGLGGLELVVPREGELPPSLAAVGPVGRLPYSALTVPSGPLRGLTAVREFTADVRMFRDELRRARPDLVLVVSATLFVALLAARLERVPSIVYAGEVLTGGELRGWQRRFAGWLVVGLTGRLARHVVACSSTVAEQYAGGPPVQVILPPMRGDYAAGDREGCRENFGIGPDDICIASVGNITSQRGQDVLVHAMAEVRRQIPNARCLIAGEVLPRPRDAAFRERLVGLIDELELGDAVVMPGFVERVADVYAAADVVVNPTRYESFGRVAFEAAIAGKPVVSTAAGAIPEVLRDGENALLVPPDAPFALAAAVLRLLGDRELGERLVEGGRRFAAERLDGERALEAFREVVSSVLGYDPEAAPGARGRRGRRGRPQAERRRAAPRRGDRGHA